MPKSEMLTSELTDQFFIYKCMQYTLILLLEVE